MKFIFPLLVIFISVLFLEKTLAHGGGGHAQSSEAPKVFKRQKTPTSPVTLKKEALLVYSKGGQAVPSDIAIVFCKLYGTSPCRGVGVVLYDSEGHKIATSNSGFDGVVGFQGLASGVSYIAKIQHSRYIGTIKIAAGKVWTIDGTKGEATRSH